LDFLFDLSSDKFLKYEIPFALAATKKIIKNSSIAPLFNFEGQLIDFNFFGLLIKYQQFFHLYKFFFFKKYFNTHFF
jgi:hypothetical protein